MRDQLDRRDQREQRVKGLRRALVCAAAVPVMLVAAGCSSDSGSGDKAAERKDGGAKPSASSPASASPTVQAAAYKALPEACKVLSEKTLDDLVPKAKSGKKGSSDDTSTRGSCSWSSLDNNGVKGSQFRWLNVSLLRFESDASRGAGDKLAQEYYRAQAQDARSVTGAKNTTSQPVQGVGDEATAVRYDLKKKEGSFKQETVVARTENVVVTVDYNGAGLAGEKKPDGDTLNKLAQKALKEAVAAVAKANGAGGDAGTPSDAPSKPASKSPSASPSKNASGSPSPSASKKS